MAEPSRRRFRPGGRGGSDRHLVEVFPGLRRTGTGGPPRRPTGRADASWREARNEWGVLGERRLNLAIANAKLAYRHYLEAFSGPRWEALAAKGATRQRCLWASTSTKNPAYRDVLYVEELIGPATVNTMPAETIVAFQDHGEVKRDSLTSDVEGAERLLVSLREAGIDYDDVTDTLEREGVQKFADSFEELLDGIRAKRSELATA